MCFQKCRNSGVFHSLHLLRAKDTAPTVIRIVPYGKENEDWNEDDWEEEWNNAPDENEVDE